jgi:hypothetical protein
MNFDDLKNAWKREGGSEVNLGEINLSLKKSNNAIDKVRSNMRKDFYALIIMAVMSLGGMMYVNLKLDFHPVILFTLNTFYFLTSVLVIYFFVKFLRFYRRSYHLNYDSRDNLIWFYYELRYFIDFYHTSCFVFFVMGLACGLSIGVMSANLEMVTGKQDPIGKLLSSGLASNLIYFGSQAIIIIGGVFLFRWVIEMMYGRYLKQIKHTLDLLKPEE